MKVSELLKTCKEFLSQHDDVEVDLYYFDPADGESGTGVNTSDYSIHTGAGHFTISLEHDVSSILLDPDAVSDDDEGAEIDEGDLSDAKAD